MKIARERIDFNMGNLKYILKYLNNMVSFTVIILNKIEINSVNLNNNTSR